MDNDCDSLPAVTTDDGVAEELGGVAEELGGVAAELGGVAIELGGVAGGIMRALREDSKASMIRSRNQVTMNGPNSRLS